MHTFLEFTISPDLYKFFDIYSIRRPLYPYKSIRLQKIASLMPKIFKHTITVQITIYQSTYNLITFFLYMIYLRIRRLTKSINSNIGMRRDKHMTFIFFCKILKILKEFTLKTWMQIILQFLK